MLPALRRHYARRRLRFFATMMPLLDAFCAVLRRLISLSRRLLRHTRCHAILRRCRHYDAIIYAMPPMTLLFSFMLLPPFRHYVYAIIF